MSSATDISAAQLSANQLNALKSTGPKTEQGKANARFNARRHGMTGQFYCMSEADERAYQGFEARILKDLRPEGAYETQLAISITQDQWRLNRSRVVEFNIIGHGHDEHADHTIAPTADLQAASTQAQTFLATQKAFANIALYETRLRRLIEKNEKRLEELQAARRKTEASAREEAELLVRLSRHTKEPIASIFPAMTAPNGTDFIVNGFVFSKLELLRDIVRHDRLAEARKLFRK